MPGRRNNRNGNSDATDYLRLMYNQQNRTVFNKPFVKTNTDTIPFVLAVDNYFRTNPGIPGYQQYQIVYDQMPITAQEAFIAHCELQAIDANNHNDNQGVDEADVDITDQLSLQNLKKWIVQTWTPPHNRRDIVSACYQVRFGYNEDPNMVLMRIKTKMAQANKCVAIINKGIDIEADQLSKLTKNEKYDILLHLFYAKNTSDGALNKKARKLVIKNDPKTLEALLENIQSLHNKIKPSCVYGLDSDEYQYHKHDESDLNVYASARKLKRKRESDTEKIFGSNKKSKPNTQVFDIPCRYGSKCSRKDCKFVHKASDPKQKSVQSTGKVVYYNDAKRYGFIELNDGSDQIFVHKNDIIDKNKSLYREDSVSFDINVQANGRKNAKRVKKLSENENAKQSFKRYDPEIQVNNDRSLNEIEKSKYRMNLSMTVDKKESAFAERSVLVQHLNSMDKQIRKLERAEKKLLKEKPI